MSDQLKKGLEGVLVAESSLSYIDGDAGKLVYRGYDIEDLARNASFEEVLYLLWHGHLPNEAELAEFSDAMAEERHVDDNVLQTVEQLAAADENPMAALRTGVSMLSANDPKPACALSAFVLRSLAEIVAAETGLGFMIQSELERLSLTGILTWTLIFTLFILFVEYGILQQIEKRMFEWRQEVSIGFA
jgi:citrate synthase